MKEILEKSLKGEVSALETIIHIVYFLRPGRWQTQEDSEYKLLELTHIIKENPHLGTQLRVCISELIDSTKHIDLFAESGILSNAGFFTTAFLKISYKIFPPVPNVNELNECLSVVFHRNSDYQWLQNISILTWEEFLKELYPDTLIRRIKPNVEVSLLDSMLFISHRIAAMGVEPLLTTQIPSLETSESPLVKLSTEISSFVQDFKDRRLNVNEHLEKVNKLIEECEKTLDYIREVREADGTSLSLTYVSMRLHQNIERMKVLTYLLAAQDDVEQYRKAVLSFFISSVRHENVRFKLREHLSQNIGVMAYQITDHASKTGEHYITSSPKEYKKMLASASKGGFIVGFLVVIKTLIYYMSLAPFGRAFLYSMNYSFGFIAVHLIHGTIATKQPAMTANHIATSLDSTSGSVRDLKGLSDLIVRVFRSQFIAFVGNLAVVFPVSLILAILYFYVLGGHLAGPEKAHHLIHEINPIHSPAIFHAAIAGVCLFVAGLISGYYDNIVRFRKIPERVENHPLLRKLMKKAWRAKVSNYLSTNMGSLAGNFFLGVFLGSIGTIGSFIGWNIDIRHITFSTGNFAVALVGLDFKVTIYDIAMSILGIVGIGIFNFAVSFGLALFVAIRSRNVNFQDTRYLIGMVWRHFMNNPLDFVRPPKSE